MKETMARLMQKVPTKISAPRRTARHDNAEKKSEIESNISNAAGTRFQRELATAIAISRRRSVSPDLRVAVEDSQRPAKTRRGRARRHVRGPALLPTDRSRRRL